MVWPEWQEVDGQRVLVPKVYLAHKTEAEPDQVGALIAGQSVRLETVSCPSVRNSVIAEFQPLFFSKISLSGLVFDGVVALVGAALCLLFVQNLTHTQALSLADADSAV